MPGYKGRIPSAKLIRSIGGSILITFFGCIHPSLHPLVLNIDTTMTRALLEQAFGTSDKPNIDLYDDVLKCPRDASSAQLRKAYYKQARVYHPDKNATDAAATLKFQAISFAYNWLKNPERRADYDQDGVLPEENDMDGGDDDDNNNGTNDWKDYFDKIFGKITSTKVIDDFVQKYKMSDEEERDVLKCYESQKGDLVKCLEFVMCSEERDVERWMEDYIQPAIDKGKVPNFEERLKTSRAKIAKKLVKLQKEEKQTQEENDDGDEDETETETEESDQEPPPTKKASHRRTTKTKKTTTNKKAKPTKAKIKKAKKASSSLGPSQDLIAAIRNKGGRRDPFASLGARYGVDAMEDDPLDDAAFERLRSKLGKRKN